MKRITVQLLSLLICLCSISSSALAYSIAHTSYSTAPINFTAPAPTSRSSFGALTLSATTVDPSGSITKGITLRANAVDADGTVAKVEFYAGSTLIGFSATAPYSATWPVTAMGTYVLTARATDNVGASTVSSPVTIKVGDGITYLHNDLAGNPIAATDSSGAIIWKENFQPYGERLNTPAAASDNRQWFHGKAVDADTGLSYFGARYYDAALGRFMGVDPVGFDPGNLHSFNRYAYGNNNPYRFTDPDGRAAETILDVVSLGLSIREYRQSPSFWNGIGVAIDAIGVAVPFIPGGIGSLRAMAGAVDASKGEVTVYRVFGGDARAQGFSWTTNDPRTVNNFRDAAGLPSGGPSGATNTADFLIKGRANASDVINSRSALPLDGNKGGLPELIIDPKNVRITDFSVLKP